MISHDIEWLHSDTTMAMTFKKSIPKKLPDLCKWLKVFLQCTSLKFVYTKKTAVQCSKKISVG